LYCDEEVLVRGWISVAFHDYFLTNRKRSGGFWLVRGYILTGGFGDRQSSGTRTSLTDSRHGNLNFRRVIYFRFRSGRVSISGRVSASGIAAELRLPVCVTWGPWKCRFYATYLARMCHCRCPISFPGRPLRSRLTWQGAATYVTWRCGFRSFRQNPLLTRLGIDASDWQNPRLYRDANSTWENWPKMGTTPSPNLSGNRKLTRSQINVHKISLATANASCNASIDYSATYRLRLTFPTTYFPTGKVISAIGKCRRGGGVSWLSLIWWWLECKHADTQTVSLSPYPLLDHVHDGLANYDTV